MLLDAVRLSQRKDFDPAALVTYVSHGFTLGRRAAKRHALTRGSTRRDRVRTGTHLA
jgi:hypothetical protein